LHERLRYIFRSALTLGGTFGAQLIENLRGSFNPEILAFKKINSSGIASIS
jgi:hypothetical protein